MSDTFLLESGFQFSSALDPHRRSAYSRAISEACQQVGGKPSIALVGWQAATLLGVALPLCDRIVIVEQQEELFDSIRQALMAEGLGGKVTLLKENPATVTLDERVDIAVAALNTPWFVEIPAGQILANLKSQVLKANGMMIPRRFVHLFELASSATDVGGVTLRVPRYGRPGEPFPVLSESKHWSTTDFTLGADFNPDVDDTIIVKPLLSGTLTGLRLSTLVELTDNTVHLAGHSGYQALFVPLRENLDVTAHQPVTIYARFTMGDGLTCARFIGRSVDDTSESPQPLSPDVVAAFRKRVEQMIQQVDELGRGADLDKVVTYTFDPHGDVSRLTALFWTVDDEFRKPLRQIVEQFRREAAQSGTTASDEQVYELMLEAYRDTREQGAQ